MKITIKKLQGVECTVEVQPSMFIRDLKTLIFEELDVPEVEQKLLLNGKTLADEQTIESYPSIKDGTKLNLIVTKPETLREAAYKLFKQHYREPDATNITVTFMKLVEKKFDALSLDDIERLAINAMNGEQERHE